MLGALGAAPYACGGSADGISTGAGTANLEGAGSGNAGNETGASGSANVSDPAPTSRVVAHGAAGAAGAPGTWTGADQGGAAGAAGAAGAWGLGGAAGAAGAWGLGGAAGAAGAWGQGGAAGAAGAGMAAGGGPVETPSVASACVFDADLGGGWERCTNGMLHRSSRGLCASALPRPEPLTVPPAAYPGQQRTLACAFDRDCTDAAYGHCEYASFQIAGTFCAYGCVSDTDCDAGKVCVCGDPVGHCAPATCRDDAACGSGALCGSYVSNPGCGGTAFACQAPDDECAADSDCAVGESCALAYSAADGLGEPIAPLAHRVCTPPLCAFGRPFLVGGAARLAPSVVRSDWYDTASMQRSMQTAMPAEPLAIEDAELRAEVVRGWTEQALMEHASVAAFARFTLQLLSLGAPSELCLASAQAMADEIRHTGACFGLARRHGGSDVGPGPLGVSDALSETDLSSVVLGTLREGCVGETLAALEAAEALQHCEDPSARAVLEQIAAEETRHAELAWRFVAWALESGPRSLVEQVRRAFAEELAETVPRAQAELSAGTFDHELARHGLLSDRVRAALRPRVVQAIIAPCARALLARADAATPGAALPPRSELGAASVRCAV